MNQPTYTTYSSIPNPDQLQLQSVQNSSTNQNRFTPFLLSVFVLLLFVLLLIVGAGAYYLGTQNSDLADRAPDNRNVVQVQPSPVSPSQAQPTFYPSPSPTPLAWKTESIQIKKSTTISGNETINLSVQLPTTWSLSTVSKPMKTSNLIEDCADYIITNDDSSTRVTVSPVCTGWSAEYLNWPQSAVVIKQEKNVGDDAHTAYTVRYLDTVSNQIKYVDGERGSSNKIMDAMLVTYDSRSGKFLPTRIAVNYSVTDSDSLFEITDRIVTSIKAQ